MINNDILTLAEEYYSDTEYSSHEDYEVNYPKKKQLLWIDRPSKHAITTFKHVSKAPVTTTKIGSLVYTESYNNFCIASTNVPKDEICYFCKMGYSQRIWDSKCDYCITPELRSYC